MTALMDALQSVMQVFPDAEDLRAGNPGGGIPIISDPPATAPPELARFGGRIFGFLKVVSGVVGACMMAAAWIKVMWGKSSRQHMAAEGMSHAGWVLVGLGGVLLTIPIVDFVANWS
ncbi:hypothetical protein GCM10009733_006210 [Nonomuraea maheshkhaliensis]|uniref:Conjugal transfer protein TrbC n=1 Tax=Nonomuraea maheshkhaliensis TaxID=419590 RepID=A0ABN2EQ69_9ACTN